MLVHTVYLWVHDHVTEKQRRAFRDGLKGLAAAPGVVHGWVGVPADISRDVIDRSYSYSLVLVFEDVAAHDEFQRDPAHQRFRETFRGCWKKVQIYDSVETAD